MSIKNKILVFTGAGVSQESGIKTFRDSNDGLWCEYKIEDVASIEGWKKNREKVLNFYNLRRKEMKSANPNKAHKLIAELENHFDVMVVTQNVDNLHERAGSTNVIHLHGELNKVRSTFDSTIKFDWEDDLNIGDKCPEGSQMRPDIVWFGEVLDGEKLKLAKEFASQSDVCIVIGTSMQVSPANTIPFLTKDSSVIYYIDPGSLDFFIPANKRKNFIHYNEKASIGMEKVYKNIKSIYLK